MQWIAPESSRYSSSFLPEDLLPMLGISSLHRGVQVSDKRELFASVNQISPKPPIFWQLRNWDCYPEQKVILAA